jgi:hypothetical protein
MNFVRNLEEQARRSCSNKHTHSTRMASFCVFFFYRPTGRPRRTSLPLEWNECLAELATTDMQKFKSYKDFCIRNKKILIRVLVSF